MPRIAPLPAPYPAEIQGHFDQVMPPGVPPLALFTTLAVMLGASVWLAVLAWMLVCLFVAGVLVAWARFARDVLPLSALPGSMSYALAKVPLYLRFLVRRQVEWVRSRRDSE